MAGDGSDSAHIWVPYVTQPRAVEQMTGGQERLWYLLKAKGAERWDRVLPGQIVSYKWDIWARGLTDPPATARIVSCHGEHNRPHLLAAYGQRWVRRHWTRQLPLSKKEEETLWVPNDWTYQTTRIAP